VHYSFSSAGRKVLKITCAEINGYLIFFSIKFLIWYIFNNKFLIKNFGTEILKAELQNVKG